MKQETFPMKVFINKILSGTALGVIIGLIPNAVLSAFLTYFKEYALALQLLQIVTIFQLATPLIIGGLISLQFELSPLQMMVTAGSCFVASGVVRFDSKIGSYVGIGTGDLINTMLTAAIAILSLLWIKDKFGSTAVVILPIMVGVGVSYIGLLLLPYVSAVTLGIGRIINEFTYLQPFLMSLFIACSFAILIISPISTVAIGLAIQLNGLAAGAAAMGVAATTVTLVIYSLKVNKPGVTLAIALGGMKLMMPNLFRHPIILLPCLTTASFSSVCVALFLITGTPQSAGFGLVGLVGPLASIELGLQLWQALVAWIIVPSIVAIASKFIYERLLKLYDSTIVFKFQS